MAKGEKSGVGVDRVKDLGPLTASRELSNQVMKLEVQAVEQRAASESEFLAEG